MGRRFMVKELLGKGGSGEVYAGSMVDEDGTKTPVAIKVLRNLFFEPEPWRRLVDEFRQLQHLSHPNIVGCYALTKMADQDALVMELVEGADLSRCARDTFLPLRAVVQIIQSVAEALDVAGSTLGLVHRDIKPGNIRVSWEGRVVLLDFGLARSDSLMRAAKTKPGHVNGTWQYIAPEQLRAKSSFASDIFSLGAVLYGLVTGKRLTTSPHFEGHVPHCRTATAWTSFLGQRLSEGERLDEDPGLLALVSDMLLYEPSERPDAREVVTRCEVLSQRLLGPSLRDWAQARRWPPAGQAQGDLSWRVFEEEDGEYAQTTSEVIILSASEPPPPPALGPERRSVAVGWGVGGVLGALALVVLVGVGFVIGRLNEDRPLDPERVVVVEPVRPRPSSKAKSDVAPRPPISLTYEAQEAPPKAAVGQKETLPRRTLPASRPVPVRPVGPSPKPVAQKPMPTPNPGPSRSTSPLLIDQPKAQQAQLQVLGDAPRTWVTQLGQDQQIPLRPSGTELEPGTYEVWAEWQDGSTGRALRHLHIEAGVQRTVKCTDAMEICTLQPDE